MSEAGGWFHSGIGSQLSPEVHGRDPLQDPLFCCWVCWLSRLNSTHQQEDHLITSASPSPLTISKASSSPSRPKTLLRLLVNCSDEQSRFSAPDGNR